MDQALILPAFIAGAYQRDPARIGLHPSFVVISSEGEAIGCGKGRCGSLRSLVRAPLSDVWVLRAALGAGNGWTGGECTGSPTRPWGTTELTHVNFGQVQGMSTRAGNVIFLTDILDEARERMLELIHRNEAKLAEVDDPHHVAEVMGQ